MTVSIATANYLRNGKISHRWAFHVKCRDRDTGTIVPVNIWNSRFNATLTINGEQRTYIGGQSEFSLDNLRQRSGLYVIQRELTVSDNHPEVTRMVRTLDPRRAECELHIVFMHPGTNKIASIERRFRGFVNGTPIVTAARGGVSKVAIKMVSNTQTLTQTLAGKKSDESQKKRGGDRGRRYGSGAGVPPQWGAKSESNSQSTRSVWGILKQ